MGASWPFSRQSGRGRGEGDLERRKLPVFGINVILIFPCLGESVDEAGRWVMIAFDETNCGLQSMNLHYPRQLRFVARSGGVSWVHFAFLVVTLGFTLWGFFGPSRPMLALAAICGLWLAFELYNRHADETHFLVDLHEQSFVVRQVSFGHSENEVRYPLDTLKGFEIDDVGNGYARIVAVLGDGRRIPLQSSPAEFYYGFAVKRMNGILAELRTGDGKVT
jgi:hypothetical protein